MGLIGFLGVALVTGSNLVIADPFLFSTQPPEWMAWCARFGATIIGAPNFAYDIARFFMRTRPPGDLSSVRLALNGAEPVDVGTCEEFMRAGKPFGLRPDCVLPVYGLAEATLAVTFPHIKAPFSFEVIDRKALESGTAVLSPGADPLRRRRLPLLGSALEGLEVRIESPTGGCEAAPREVGPVLIRGNSVIDHYLGDPTLDDEWFDTGDLGYMVNGELVICGRAKDIIVIAGRNIYHEEGERAVANLDGIYRGHVAIFGVEDKGKESVVVIAEADAKSNPGLANRVARVAGEYLDVRISDVRLVSPSSIPRTTSGKVSRSASRIMYDSL
jgi:fatty-acyl-CoA synthase